MVLLALNAVSSLVFAVTDVGELQLLERFRRGDPVAPGEVVDAIDRSELIGEIGLWLFIVSGVVWLVWQHHAHANLHAAGVEGLGFTSRWRWCGG
jgi:hypothetical protein